MDEDEARLIVTCDVINRVTSHVTIILPSSIILTFALTWIIQSKWLPTYTILRDLDYPVIAELPWICHPHLTPSSGLPSKVSLWITSMVGMDPHSTHSQFNRRRPEAGHQRQDLSPGPLQKKILPRIQSKCCQRRAKRQTTLISSSEDQLQQIPG